MPHMMPMLWIIIFFSSFLSLFFLSSLIYFFHLPNLSILKKSPMKFHKWTWMW